ncbi:MAG TPA: hypothetical protein VJV03_15520 [Pyrinomonadaceae bacterium]|nr:hypothetical protein [Pyrinomonadaceae bacterium]
MMKKKSIFPVLLLVLALPVVVAAQAKNTPKNQLASTRSELISATEAYKTSAQEVIKFQEQEVANATAKAEQLRQLVADGLIARNDLVAAEQEIATATSKLEATKKQIADSDNLIAQIHQAEKTEKALAKATQSRRLVHPVSMRYYGMAGWALSNISSVQTFFSTTFGRPLPISTMGQSSTHNAMRWDHRNSADVGVHPDSAEGRALIAFLQSKGIPFLAFRGAIPGVSTGPHIHIGYPSGRLG